MVLESRWGTSRASVGAHGIFPTAETSAISLHKAFSPRGIK